MIHTLVRPGLPAISVLMPCFNPGKFVQEAVASVLAQPECLELIVADGGSSDGSLPLLEALTRQHPRLRIINGPDQGPADALNQAFALARGTLIGWLNADDISPPGALSRAMQALACNPDWLMVYGEGEEFNASTGQRQRYPTLQPQVGIAGFRSHCFICQPTVVFRRSMGLLLGPFDLQWRTAFDFDYWLRAFAAFPHRIGYIPSLQGLTRLHGATITSRQRAQVALEATALLARHFGHAPPTRLHCYGLELQLGLAALPADVALADHLAQVFAQAAPFLAPADLAQLQRDWLLDPDPAPAQPDAEQHAAAQTSLKQPGLQILQIVQPFLRPNSPGPRHKVAAALATAQLDHPLLQQDAGLLELIQASHQGQSSTTSAFGVNLIVASDAPLELQQWTTALAELLNSASVPYSLSAPGPSPGPHAINLLALTPTQQATWLLAHGVAPHRNRLTIAAWPWIANAWPEPWLPLLELVDEIWAPSRLLAEALSSSLRPPVWSMPPIAPACAGHFPPRHRFRVAMAANLQAPPHLQNTFGAVEVFQRAFPLSMASLARPHLLILVDHAHASEPEWQWLQAWAARDSHIQLREADSLEAAVRLQTIAACSVWLSLQRSHPLPSALAVAQQLGLQVVATAHGAALDLPASPNLHLVPATPVAMPRGVIPDGDGMPSAEPDLDAAVLLLRAAVQKRSERLGHGPGLANGPMALQLKERLQGLWQQHHKPSSLASGWE